jgi:hypothetical protein
MSPAPIATDLPEIRPGIARKTVSRDLNRLITKSINVVDIQLAQVREGSETASKCHLSLQARWIEALWRDRCVAQ